MSDFVIQHGEPFRDGEYAFVRGHKIERELASPTQYYLLGPKTTKGVRGADVAADPCRRPNPEGAGRAAPLHVGVVRVGGIGDDLMLAAHCAAIKRRFPHAHVTAFVRDNTGILAGHPAIDRMVVRCGGRWREIVRDLREHFDIFYDLRYVAKVWAFHPDYAGYAHECRERFESLAWYYANWYDSNNRLEELGRNLVDLTNETICCPGPALSPSASLRVNSVEGSVDDVRVHLRPEDRKLARLMHGRKYAVVHNGAGGGCAAKKWPLRHWQRLVGTLRGEGLDVLQIGWPQEELIRGAHDLRGLTTLREAAGLIEGARVVVDTEGSVIHLAQAVRQRDVVALFGPTPKVCFAYPEHEAVETPLECRGCWYANPEWHVKCPQGYNGFPCMEAITPQRVMEAVAEIMKRDDPASSPRATANTGATRSQATQPRPNGARRRARTSGVGPLSVAIAIPTRDRPQSLARLLDSIGRQTVLPDRILIVDDNLAPGQVTVPRLGVPVDIIRGPRRGPARAHQVALIHSREDLILRLDDDLVLESPDFVERLYRVMCDDPKVGAVGGVYPPSPSPLRRGYAGRGLRRTGPQPGDNEEVAIERIGGSASLTTGGGGYSLTIGGMLRGEDSAQFYRWNEARLVEAEHLYSSFMYRREAALAIGGFATCYSDQAHREETDFTHRLYLARWKLLVDTGAVARHEQASSGGLRAVAREELRRADEVLFLERLRSGALKAAA